VLTVRSFAAGGTTAHVAALAALASTVGLGAAGWAVGLACGAGLNVAVARALARASSTGPGPADVVTLARALLACGVAALTADALAHHGLPGALVPLTVVALVLDAVDGWVARTTRTSSEFGKRFDGEVDAFLILVLSVYVARSFGAWVLAAGLVRYAFALAGVALPWLRAGLTYRYWRKVVTAAVGIALTTAAADVLPGWLTLAALLLALTLLAESFGRDTWWLWRHRPGPGSEEATTPAVAVVTEACASGTAA
jgi:phosphatidylglycerophosphate synthase